MTAIYILLPLSLLVATGFLAAFIWAVRSGQYEDTATPSMRVLFDDPHQTKGRPERSLKDNQPESKTPIP